MTARQYALFLVAVAVCCAGAACHGSNTSSALPPGANQIRGAGAIFPAPLYTYPDPQKAAGYEKAFCPIPAGSGERAVPP